MDILFDNQACIKDAAIPVEKSQWWTKAERYVIQTFP
jgi:hypothetical protein